MSTCTIQTGMLLWKKFCGAEAAGNCRQCHAFVCARHGATYGDGSLLCTGCGAQVDDDSTGTVFTTSTALFGLGAGAATGAAAAEQQQQSSETWHGGGDTESSSSSDSGSSDSGGGDSGGSSSD